ncbi:MAG: hypothetical protein L3J82_08430 [Planctomycetes bacterium]|nr:hypothetical protein [Planctomycetota bacterium]
MKNFALMVVAIAFGAVMLTGCPGGNNTTKANAGGDDHKEGDDHKDDDKKDDDKKDE